MPPLFTNEISTIRFLSAALELRAGAPHFARYNSRLAEVWMLPRVRVGLIVVFAVAGTAKAIQTTIMAATLRILHVSSLHYTLAFDGQAGQPQVNVSVAAFSVLSGSLAAATQVRALFVNAAIRATILFADFVPWSAFLCRAYLMLCSSSYCQPRACARLLFCSPRIMVRMATQ